MFLPGLNRPEAKQNSTFIASPRQLCWIFISCSRRPWTLYCCSSAAISAAACFLCVSSMSALWTRAGSSCSAICAILVWDVDRYSMLWTNWGWDECECGIKPQQELQNFENDLVRPSKPCIRANRIQTDIESVTLETAARSRSPRGTVSIWALSHSHLRRLNLWML